ncbi:hypothetical protein PoB_006081600 [Plakobranchus ocellatus]|uniref:Uncharacterized protein n=1 Tax=Plakobranchus ocellatus TaxID=259542 RepID=A0AAV4CR36_9GAST|nr:hypothetical protein PoB_006081600 [Plakobranchus ocellatus]
MIVASWTLDRQFTTVIRKTVVDPEVKDFRLPKISTGTKHGTGIVLCVTSTSYPCLITLLSWTKTIFEAVECSVPDQGLQKGGVPWGVTRVKPP